MKITNGIDSTSSLERPATDQAGSTRAKPAASVTAGTDTIRISELSTHLAAIEGRVGFVVAGDSDLLDLREYDGIRIVNPRAFLDLLVA